MSRLCLVRHGSTSWTGRRYCGRANPGLSPEGLAEAEASAAKLAGIGLGNAEIVASPLRRARETADIISSRLGAAVREDAGLQEVDFGAAEGLSFDDIGERFPELVARILAGDTAIDWPGGETAEAVRTRVRDASERLRAIPGDIVVVSHGLAIRMLIDALDMPGHPGAAATLVPAGILVIDREAPSASIDPALFMEIPR